MLVSVLAVCSCVLGKRELVAVLAVCSCVLGEDGAGLDAVLAVCSCMLGKDGAGPFAGCLLVYAREEGAGRCAGCLFVCVKGKGNWSLCWLSARVCLGNREPVAVLVSTSVC